MTSVARHRTDHPSMKHLRFDAVSSRPTEDLIVHLCSPEHGMAAAAVFGRPFTELDRMHDDDHLAGQREARAT